MDPDSQGSLHLSDLETENLEEVFSPRSRNVTRRTVIPESLPSTIDENQSVESNSPEDDQFLSYLPYTPETPPYSGSRGGSKKTIKKKEKKIPIFCYGSNGLKQLQDRCENSNLKNYKAILNDYKRIFAGNSSRWHGGVASLIKENNNKCRGSVVFLTKKEIKLLDDFEKGYKKKVVKIETFMNSKKLLLNGLTYIKNDNTWEKMPSINYMQACWKHLSPFWLKQGMDKKGNILIFDSKGFLHGKFNGKNIQFKKTRKNKKI
jgi:gamma-glutamylcyclotransferase (GGCT)/AIG2-like uncharacterized protein YtfP